MAYDLAPNALKWARPLDPSDVSAYVCYFKSDLSSLMGPSEVIASFSVEPTAEAAAYGLEVADGDYAPTLYDNAKGVKVFLRVATAQQTAEVFNGDGIWLPVVFRVVTDATPVSIFEYSCAVLVRQK